MPFLWLIPEEKHSLCKFLMLRLCRKNRLESIWIQSGVPCLGAYGHRRWREVLHLLKLKVQTLGYYGQFGHVFFSASGVAAYKIGDYLLTQIFACVYLVKDFLKLFKLAERWFPHQSKNVV